MSETPKQRRAALAPVRNVMSFDVEDLDALNFESMAACRQQKLESRVQANMNVILDVLAERQARSTMFFLGTVAQRFPELVRRAQAEGHEIASHGYAHEMVCRQTPAEFRADVLRSVDILQQITGQPVRGYRAPSWSISRSTPWAYEILAELGFLYDASLFPFSTYLYGDSTAPVGPFSRQVGARTLYEVPASVVTLLGRRFPFGGGFYLRALPWWATRLATWLVNRSGRAVIFYLHPREIDPDQPRYNLPWRDRLVAYANLRGTLGKLRKILALGPTSTVWECLQTACGLQASQDASGTEHMTPARPKSLLTANVR